MFVGGYPDFLSYSFQFFTDLFGLNILLVWFGVVGDLGLVRIGGIGGRFGLG